MSRPKCPNHTVEMSPTDQPRMWICPVSGAHFEADVDAAQKERKVDVFGRPYETWTVTDLGEES